MPSKIWQYFSAVYGGDLPESLGLMMNDPRFRTGGFPDTHVINQIPLIWNANQVKQGPNQPRTTDVNRILSKMFVLPNAEFAPQPGE